MQAVEKRVVIVLADISGYTRFMVENQMSAIHGQQYITFLIETLLREVNIPLRLQEIEGDALFLYSDGVNEAMDADKNEFSDRGLMAGIGELKNEPVQDIIPGLMKRIDRHVGDAPQSDDIAMMLLRYNGSEALPADRDS